MLVAINTQKLRTTLALQRFQTFCSLFLVLADAKSFDQFSRKNTVSLVSPARVVDFYVLDAGVKLEGL